MFVSKFALNLISVVLLTQSTFCSVIPQTTAETPLAENTLKLDGSEIAIEFIKQLFNYTYNEYQNVLNYTNSRVLEMAKNDPHLIRFLPNVLFANAEILTIYIAELNQFDDANYQILNQTQLSDIVYILNNYNLTNVELRNGKRFYIQYLLVNYDLDGFDKEMDQKLEIFIENFKHKAYNIWQKLTTDESDSDGINNEKFQKFLKYFKI